MELTKPGASSAVARSGRRHRHRSRCTDPRNRSPHTDGGPHRVARERLQAHRGRMRRQRRYRYQEAVRGSRPGRGTTSFACRVAGHQECLGADTNERSCVPSLGRRTDTRTAVERGANADTATKKLFEDLVLDEERHFGRFDDEVENKRFGHSCLARQAMEQSRTATGLPGDGAWSQGTKVPPTAVGRFDIGPVSSPRPTDPEPPIDRSGIPRSASGFKSELKRARRTDPRSAP